MARVSTDNFWEYSEATVNSKQGCRVGVGVGVRVVGSRRILGGVGVGVGVEVPITTGVGVGVGVEFSVAQGVGVGVGVVKKRHDSDS